MKLDGITFDNLGFPIKVESPDPTRFADIQVKPISKIVRARPSIKLDIDASLKR